MNKRTVTNIVIKKVTRFCRSNFSKLYIEVELAAFNSKIHIIRDYQEYIRKRKTFGNLSRIISGSSRVKSGSYKMNGE